MPHVPDGFSRNVIGVHGKAGADWLGGLAGTIDECERSWSIKVMPPFANLSSNYVTLVTRSDGTEAVLKLGVPDEGFQTEMEALRLYDGRGMVRLLKADGGLGAMLLERVKPGTLLSTVIDDVQAASICAEVMRRLRLPLPMEHRFPTVSTWASRLENLRFRFDGSTGPFPAYLVDKAERIFSELIGTMGDLVLLHGDLHQMNILSATREPWLAIDPKGVVGEAEYEVGAFMRNGLAPGENLERLLARRVDQLADELGFDRERILGWSLAQAVLSAWWSYEDTGNVGDEGIIWAESLAKL